MPSAISVRQLTKTYEEGAAGTLALRGIDLDVSAGELLMLMGPSGSGKTTLLSIMGCILTATSGSVRVAGKEVVGLPEKQLPPIRLEHIGCQGEEARPGIARSSRAGREVRQFSRRPERWAEAAHRHCPGTRWRSGNHSGG